MTTISKTFTCFFEGRPTTASRPRVSRKGWAYYEKSYKDWMKNAITYLNGREIQPFEGPVYVLLSVYIKQPKKPTNPYPRGDVDNYAKGPLDALTKAGVWKDDNQVVSMFVTKKYDEREGIEAWVSNIPEIDAAGSQQRAP